MAKVSEANFNVGIAKIPLQYSQASAPNLQPIAAGLADMGQAFARVEAEQKAKADTMKRYQTLTSFQDFEVNSKLKAKETLDSADPSDTGTAQKVIDNQIAYEQEWVKTLPPDMQAEFATRADAVRGGITLDAHDTQDKQNTAYYRDGIKTSQNNAAIEINKDPATMATMKANVDAQIDASGLSESEKYFAKKENARILETYGYGATVKKQKLATAQYTNDLATAAIQGAREIGTTPQALLTMISFETGGTFNVDQMGGAGGQYMGLIQFSPENQKKYGIHKGMSVGEQMGAVVQYFKDRGFKPGMSDIQLYATINGGNPNAINARDGHNGGTWGTVTDKVNSQMEGHRANAAKLLGGEFEVPTNIDGDPQFSNVLYEDRLAAQKDASIAVNQEIAAAAAQQKAEQAAMFNSLENGLNDGTMGAKDIEDARNAGWLTDYDQINKAQAIIAAKEKDAADTREFITKIGRGDLLDPTDPNNKKQMGNLYKLDGGEEKIQGMDQEYISKSLGPMIRDTGMIPGEAIKTLGTMAASNDGRKMQYALESLNILDNMNPGAYGTQVPEAIRNKADVYDALRYTMDPKELMSMLRDSADPGMQRAMNERKEMAKKELDSPDNTKVNFKAVLDHFGADQAAVGPKGQVMEDEYRSLLLFNASHGMSLEAAHEKTLLQLDRVWGNTTFDGVTTLMRNRPENFYPQVGKSHQWITDQARGELGLQDGEGVQLVSDDRTEADIARGDPPSYVPMIQKDGMWVQATGFPEINPALVPGIYQSGNIDIHNRPTVPNPSEGGYSTVDSFSYQRADGKEVLIPKVSDEGKIMSTDEAIKYWTDKGQNLGVFNSAADANKYAEALHVQQDQQYLQGIRIPKRIYFKPTAEDLAVHDKQAVVDNLNERIRDLEGDMPGNRARYLSPPTAIKNQIEELKAQKAAAEADLYGKKETATQQYMTPAQQELRDVQKQFDPLNREMQSWTDPIDEWPKADEWQALYDKVEMLKKKVEQEVMKKRTSGGVQ